MLNYSVCVCMCDKPVKFIKIFFCLLLFPSPAFMKEESCAFYKELNSINFHIDPLLTVHYTSENIYKRESVHVCTHARPEGSDYAT